MGRTAGSNVRTARALERLANLERQVTGDTRDADVVRNGMGQVRRSASRYRRALRRLHAECYGQAGANPDGWLEWMAGGPVPGSTTCTPGDHEVHDCPGGAFVITDREA